MHSTVAQKETDPKDKAAAKPDAVAAARTDRTPARPARDLRASAPQDRTKSDASPAKSSPAGNAGSAAKPIPAGNSSPVSNAGSAAKSTPAGNSPSAGKTTPVEKSPASAETAVGAATFDNSKVSSRRPAIGKWARRASLGLLLALCSGAAIAGWMHYGHAVRAMVASWAPSGRPISLLPPERIAAEQPSSPALQADVTVQAAVPPAQSAPGVAASAAAPTPETAQLLQSMSQQIEQLSASMEELKTGQQLISRYVVRNSETGPAQARTFEPNMAPEQNPAPRAAARPLRTAAAAPVRKPRPAYAPVQAGARRELEPVLRPPLPLHQ